ncbi:MAG: hypothetical protein FWG83_07820 [Oscillospiraceae bacterium]|nr:hypothetical protein [Oscillospiraceae bacterium]
MKIIMMFVTAIWGILSGIFVPLTLMFQSSLYESLPSHIPVWWLLTSLIGFVAPCFLVMLRMHRIAVPLNIAGSISILAIHFSLIELTSGVEWFYLPLLIQTLVIILIAVLTARKSKKEQENAPAKSILK